MPAHDGGASREVNIELQGAALRSSAIQLMGSGIKGVHFRTCLPRLRVFQRRRPGKTSDCDQNDSAVSA